MQILDQQRLQSLYNERLLQIKRQGVFVQLNHQQQILPAYFECSKNDYLKFKSMIDSKVSLQFCDKAGIPLMKISRQQYFAKREYPEDKYRLYLENKREMRQFSEAKQYILVKNNATIGVLSKILQRRLKGDKYFSKIENFIGDDCCTKIDIDQELKLNFSYQQDLNREQNNAIYKSFNNHLTFVKGPPGCGKSRTVSRMVKMMAQNGLKVLVGSISNIANETLIYEIVREVNEHNRLRDLAPYKRRMKKLNILINYSRKALQKMNQQANMFSINQQLYRLIVKQNKTDYYNDDNIMQEIEKLQRGQKVSNVFFSIYMKCYNDLVTDVNIVISTTINSFKLYEYSPFRPDVGIMDEAAQASWTDTYGFLSFGVKRMVFVGDQKQLRPTVIGDASANKILKETMFEKLSVKNQDYFVHLVEQYRMHPKISEFPNLYVYEGMLRNAQITLYDRQSNLDYFKKYPMSFVTHNFQQNVVQSTRTLDNKKPINEYSNIHEGSILMDLLFLIPRSEWKNVGVLTFYDMQCQILIHNLREQIPNFDQTGISVKTIDGYQGGQKDYILISTVRSNPQMNPGFCIQLNRVNVALTRAKRGLVVFGNPETLTQGIPIGNNNQNIWGKFYQYMLKTNQVLTSDQFHEILDLKDLHIKPIDLEKAKVEEKVVKQNQVVVIKKDQTLIPKFYQELTLIFESFQSLKIQQNQEELLQNNTKYRKQAKSLIGQLKKVNLQTLEEQQFGLKQKIANFLSIQAVQKVNGYKNKLNENQLKKEESFQKKFINLAQDNLTQKQCQFALNIINFLSTNLYEVMEKHSEQFDLKQLRSLRQYLAQEEKKLIDSSWAELKQDISTQVLKNFSALKERQKLITLVSLKLRFKVLLECSKEIQKLILSCQAPMNNKI